MSADSLIEELMLLSLFAVAIVANAEVEFNRDNWMFMHRDDYEICDGR